jgi:asparagine synthase (glutamine-hydrolysing)
MSGIAGVFRLKESKKDKQKTNTLLDEISHRGSRREIVKVSGGYVGINTNFDYKTQVGKNTILMDGKIYNLDSLIIKYGIQIENSLNSDSKKIPRLLKKVGKDIFGEFKGSFAMVIIDEDSNIYLARDFIGRKPLYYSRKNKKLMFASEVKSLIKFTSDIKEFPPGSYSLNLSRPKIIKTVNTDNYSIIKNPDSGIIEDKLESYLLKSMDSRINNSNLNLGVWLSGGLDSSIITALLREFSEKIHTYSVGFEGSPDLEAAKVVSDYLGTEHTEYMLDTEELFSNIPKTIYYLESFDAPLVRSTLGNMIASKISSPSDIIFSGEGGDELFAGYDYFLEYDSSRVIQKELVNAINSLHNTALQRVDRTANAYSVNVKLPILDENLLSYVMKIPPKNKVRKDKNTVKYVLRKVASKYLPEDIAWRGKDKFWEGSGIEDTLEKKINTLITDKEFSSSVKSLDTPNLRNKEEVYYYKVFKDYYADINIDNFLSFTQDFN